MCHVVRRPKECHSTYCGDLAPVLIALGAQTKLVGPEGERALPLKKLFTQNGKKPLSLKKGEILKEVLLPSPTGKTLYLKWRLRDALEFPVVSLAVHIEKNGKDRVERAKIIFCGVGPGPVEASEAEKILKNVSLDDQMIERISNQAVKEVSPMRTSIASPAYKRRMAAILLRQGLEEMERSSS
jgi:CO/xanthine dehydrogenase FAD-binding subunit